jgi:ABC-type lipoprotein release transport system permease subunit
MGCQDVKFQAVLPSTPQLGGVVLIVARCVASGSSKKQKSKIVSLRNTHVHYTEHDKYFPSSCEYGVVLE